jgi:hypothetical protein
MMTIEWGFESAAVITPPDRGSIAPRVAYLPVAPDDAALVEAGVWETLADWISTSGRLAGRTVEELARLASIATAARRRRRPRRAASARARRAHLGPRRGRPGRRARRLQRVIEYPGHVVTTLAEANAILEAQRAANDQRSQVEREASLWRDATPAECWAEGIALCRVLERALARLTPDQLERALKPDPLPEDTCALLARRAAAVP